MNNDKFLSTYGPWALIAGGSHGLGAAFAKNLAAKGLNLVLLARQSDKLSSLADEITSNYHVQVLTISIDLASPNLLDAITEKTIDLDIGLLIYNAADIPTGPFLSYSIDSHLHLLDVNCRGPVLLSYHFGQLMKKKGKGGIILMSSMASYQGTPITVHYGASKAYNLVLAEGLWYELKEHNVDVVACTAGLINTPNFIATNAKKPGIFVPKPMKPEKVAKEAINALGHKPSVVPGMLNKIASFFMRKFVSRKLAIKVVGRNTYKMYNNSKKEKRI